MKAIAHRNDAVPGVIAAIARRHQAAPNVFSKHPIDVIELV
jgi:hypothetical protein